MALRILLLIALSLASTAASVGAAEVDSFATTVGPLLAKRCSGCHNGVEKNGGLDLTRRETMLTGGDSGAALVPKQADVSLLWQRIVAADMPPKNPLPKAERAVIEAWIARGAPWQGGALDPLAHTSEQRAGYDWWSLQTLQPIVPPKSSSRARNPIDAFIEQKLTAAKLAPSPEADRRTLIRRAYFSLIGLPPTADDVDAFVADSDPAAYDKIVDRLLASPGYGERWARHWLDVVRFGESQGFERDRLRTNSWRYRDWVIEALNRDMPYDEFVRLQLAGDVLRPNDADALIATGFLTAGPWDEVGQKQQSAAMKAVVRQDEIEDLVGTVGQTFLGLTVNCARCHDHKFDPIRQTEYYQLAAALAGVHHGEPQLPAAAVADKAAALREPIAARLRALESRLAEIESPHRDRILAERKEKGKKSTAPQPIAAWDFQKEGRDSIGDLHLELKEGSYVRIGMLHLAEGYAVSPPLSKRLGAKTLEIWVQPLDLNQRDGGLFGVQSLSGSKFDAIVYGEPSPRRWSAGSNGGRRTQDFQGPEETMRSDFVHLAFTYDEEGKIAAYRNGRPYGKPYQSSGLTFFDEGNGQVVFGARQLPSEPERRLRCAVDRARLYDRALTPDEVALSAGLDVDLVSEAELAARIPAAELTERSSLTFERAQLREALERVADAKVYAVAPQLPAKTFVLHRGNPGDPRELVAAAGIASLQGVAADFGLATDAADGDRRRRLAEWITDSRNPLFARVIVNRLWHYHFGVGLVDTPNDFGFNGGRPSHPELLDWLAGELIRSGWSLKHIQRLIVTSAAFRQSSQPRADAAQQDAGNRLLWRKSPQRLEAETLRDTLLQLAGALDPRTFGPGFYDFSTYVRNSQFYDMRDVEGPTFDRRTIYRTWVRSARSSMLDVFDCPDPSTKTPQRAVTTTPLQALSLLNNSFVFRTADRFAARVEREVGPDRQRQVAQVFRHTLGRTPDETESAACEPFVEQHGLAALCRVIFNGNELLFVD